MHKPGFTEFTKIITLSSTLACLHNPRNNDNNGDVAYVSLDLTFALMRATGDNVLQHCKHLLHTYFNDLRKCALRSKN